MSCPTSLDVNNKNAALLPYPEPLVDLCYQIWHNSSKWYPSWRPNSEKCDWLELPRMWEQFAYEKAMDNSSDEISPSLRALVGSKSHLDKVIVMDYLKLLRCHCLPQVRIAEPQELETPLTFPSVENQSVVIIPMCYGPHWMFAVVRSDCVHWFDSRPGSTVPESLISHVPVSGCTGPKQTQGQEHDSGLFMLLGIRRIATGLPPIDDEQASKAIPGFRSTIFVGLLARKLTPNEEEQQEIGIDFSEGFFEDEFSMIQQSSMDNPRELDERPPDQPIILEQGARVHDTCFDDAPTTDGTMPRSSFSPGVALRVNGRIDTASRRNATTRRVSRRLGPRASQRAPKPGEDVWSSLRSSLFEGLGHRKSIIQILHAAVKSCRSFKPGQETDIALLWTIVNGTTQLSRLHRRYYGVRFYHEFETYKLSLRTSTSTKVFERMEKEQHKLRFWAGLYQEYENLGKGMVSALLCAFPDAMENLDHPAQAEAMHITRERFAGIQHDLKSAESLCLAVLECSLSHESLVVEGYADWKIGNLQDGDIYKAFVSTNPHAQLALPVVAGSWLCMKEPNTLLSHIQH